MKTIEELYNEVMASEEMKKEFLTLKPEEVEGFAKKFGCDATLDEIKAFFEEKNTASGELSDTELDQISGGKGADLNEALLSALSFGIGCIGKAIRSANKGNCGTAIKEDLMLCDA